MSSYPSIAALKELQDKFKTKIQVVKPSGFNTDWFEVDFQIREKSFRIHVDDEYQDLRIGSEILNLCLVLRSLEELQEATSFEHWCQATGVNSELNTARSYFESSHQFLNQIKDILGDIDSQISDLDFSLNAGAANFLRVN